MATRGTSMALVMSAGAIFAWPAMADGECACDDGHHCAGGLCAECDDEACTCECCHPPVEDGCTPGYWKQEQHFDSWPTGLAPEDLFVDVFGIDAFPDMTLLDVLEQGGGGLIALGRHSVAGLLNSLSDGVAYPYTDSYVLDGFEHAWDIGVYSKVKNRLANANEIGCPLD